jgi:hypothetical protein
VELVGHRAREQRCPTFCLPCLPQNTLEIMVGAFSERTSSSVSAPVAVVVVVVSGELAYPEISPVASARAANAISLFCIAVNSQRKGKLDASTFFQRGLEPLPGKLKGDNGVTFRF